MIGGLVAVAVVVVSASALVFQGRDGGSSGEHAAQESKTDTQHHDVVDDHVDDQHHDLHDHHHDHRTAATAPARARTDSGRGRAAAPGARACVRRRWERGDLGDER